MKKILFAIACSLLLATTGCNNTSNKGDGFSISINYDAFNLIEGESFALSVKSSPNIKWTCSNSLVCSIIPSNENCVVYGEAVGSATITAISGQKRATCLVTVQPKEAAVPDPSYDDLTLDDFLMAVERSEPTKAVTNTKFYDNTNDLTLSFTSTLVVDYSDVVKTMYTYSYQSLNEITSNNTDFISTHSGVYYSKGSSIGEATDNGIVWNNDFEGSINLLTFDLKKIDSNNNGASNKTIINNVIDGSVSNEFLKGTTSDISNANFSLVIEHDGSGSFRVRRTYLSFEMKAQHEGKERNFEVISDTKYTYKPETIEYDW